MHYLMPNKWNATSLIFTVCQEVIVLSDVWLSWRRRSHVLCSYPCDCPPIRKKWLGATSHLQPWLNFPNKYCWHGSVCFLNEIQALKIHSSRHALLDNCHRSPEIIAKLIKSTVYTQTDLKKTIRKYAKWCGRCLRLVKKAGEIPSYCSGGAPLFFCTLRNVYDIYRFCITCILKN